MQQSTFDGVKEYRAAERRRRDNRIGGALFFVVTLAVGLAWCGFSEIEKQVDKCRAVVDVQLAAANEFAERSASIRATAAPIAKQALLDSSLVDAVPKSRALAEVANALPSTATLLSVRIDSNANRRAATLHASGTASNEADVNSFIAHLQNSSILENLRLISGANVLTNGVNRRRFEFECNIASTLPADSAAVGRTVAIELEPLQ